MHISKESFFSVGLKLNLTNHQMESYWQQLEKYDDSSKTASFPKYLFYLGALIVLSAMGWLMSLGVEQFGGGGLFVIATAYSLFFLLLGSFMWNRGGLRIPSGLLITLAVCMVPVAIHGLESYFNFWVEDGNSYHDFFLLSDGHGIFMELGTIIAGSLALYFFPFPFLTVPIFIALYFLSIDAIPFFIGKATLIQQYWCSVFIGLMIMLGGFFLDFRKKGEFGFWAYLFGSLIFWIGLNGLTWDQGEWVSFVFLLINLLMMYFSILVRRKVLMVFGALGVFSYLGHLAYTVFNDSILFPFVLSFIGLLIIYCGYLYQRYSEKIERFLVGILPKSLRDLFDRF